MLSLQRLLKPEKILMGEDAQNLGNSYQGIVQEFLYLGEFTKYRIELSPSVTLTVKATNRRDRRLLTKGEKIVIGWGRDEMLLVETEVPPDN